MNKFLFYASARLFGEACLELYICRFTPDGKEQVYLLSRPANDPFYPSMLHMPGARKIPTETSAENLARAFSETPFNLNICVVEYVLSETYEAKRGVEYADVRRVVVSYHEGQINFHDVDNIPNNTIEHHKVIIKTVKQR